MATSIYGVDYEDVWILYVVSGNGQVFIDPGSFADTSEDPPVGWTATQNGAAQTIGGLYNTIVAVASTSSS